MSSVREALVTPGRHSEVGRKVPGPRCCRSRTHRCRRRAVELRDHALDFRPAALVKGTVCRVLAGTAEHEWRGCVHVAGRLFQGDRRGRVARIQKLPSSSLA